MYRFLWLLLEFSYDLFTGVKNSSKFTSDKIMEVIKLFIGTQIQRDNPWK